MSNMKSELICRGICEIYNAFTPWSRALHDKPTGPQLVKKFSSFYGTRRFITAFTRSRHLPLFWASSIQSMPPHPISWRSILILSSHLRLGLPSGLFPSGLPTKTVFAPLLSPVVPRSSPNTFFWIWSPEWCLVFIDHETPRYVVFPRSLWPRPS